MKTRQRRGARDTNSSSRSSSTRPLMRRSLWRRCARIGQLPCHRILLPAQLWISSARCCVAFLALRLLRSQARPELSLVARGCHCCLKRLSTPGKPGLARPLPSASEHQRTSSIGGFGFFGDYLKWSSQHAYSIFPEYRYNPKPADDEPTWTPAKEWVSLAGQQRELLYVEDGNICYAGTFLCHAGPQSVKVEELGDDVDESFVNALARKTFNVNIKNPQSRQSKAKTYVPLLANLYTEGTATVRILGLQRVGFNEKLFQILRRAYDKRDRKGAAGANTSTPDAEPTSTKKRKKQNIDFFAELFGEPEEAEGGIPGPSKVPRLDESALMFDETTVWRS
ncbi:hypothetical protein L227DRAFT_228767 [Lentinus tigrinus ALCF2SS1-6]|uniref:Uncharacterized protein n=1 Tax=Lentinus tigrinus ALCF2SS1-6 TaxID=1328759 RepID=A0A5C2S1K8_9APHY|nr:hypothetical protein L227DRAFT_228767 [Lentinus tigrinus ALCF2SS1-6]